MARVLVVDDEQSLLNVLTALLKAHQHEVIAAQGGEKAIAIFQSDKNFDIVLSDIRMSPVDGLQVLKHVHASSPATPVVMLTAYSSVETAIEALKFGAFDYVTKPFKIDDLLATLKAGLEYGKALERQLPESKIEEQEIRCYLGDIVAESSSMRNVCDMIKRIAPTDTAVLICGENGTGKELIAKTIHLQSNRKDNKFLRINCAEIPEPLLEAEIFGQEKAGLLELADNGTVFMEEIDSVPNALQEKLSRVMQERKFQRLDGKKTVPLTARILTAANTNLQDLVAQGGFRSDLCARLSPISIEVKSLRERKEDILPLALHIVQHETPEGRQVPRIDNEVVAILKSYSWPGNIPEMKNALKQAIDEASDNKITKDKLPEKIASTPVNKSAKSGGNDLEASRGKALKAFITAKGAEYRSQLAQMTKKNKQDG